jgi:hypothetical protein
MVATDWTALGQTTIAAAAALGGGVVGAWVQGRTQARTERHRRREQAAQVLADLATLLEDADPEGKLTRRHSNVDEVLRLLADRRNVLRARLLTLAAGQPSRPTRRLFRELDRAVTSSLISNWFLGMSEDASDREELRDEAKREHARAQGILDQLLDRL